MAASLSRSDPSSPASVAEAGFSTARRGYHQDEVRAFLVSVAAELERLQERERQLEAQLLDERAVGPVTPELDDETVAAMLGEETLRVLQTARESASQIKVRAEESAARIVREANDEANRLRQDAEVEAARRRHDATSDAEAEVALAKQQGREMVNEARAYRERVLADLDRRTTLARQQIEELVHGRDRLLQVFERARLVAVDVTSELQAIDGPDELVNLAPTTGPVPLMVPAARPASKQPTAEAATTDDAETADDADAARSDEGEPTDAAEGGSGDDDRAEPDDAAATAPDGDQVDDDAVDVAVDVEPESDAEVGEGAIDDGSPDEAGGDEARPARDGNVVSLFPDRAGRADGDEAGSGQADVGGIFARLRSEVTGDDGAGGAAGDDAEHADAEPDGTDPTVEAEADSAFARRDEALVPLIVAAARKLKRSLADEQNGVLDALRRQDPIDDLDVLVAPIDVHVAAYCGAIADELVAAAAAGAGELGANDTKTLRRSLSKAGSVDAAQALVRGALVEPLRERLARAISDGADDRDDITKRVRAVYREWKTQHIDGQLDDVFRAAHGGGLSVTATPGTPMIWTIDPSEPTCADCEDNSLAGPVPAGEPFPTGDPSAPAHPGCRCLTLPASQ